MKILSCISVAISLWAQAPKPFLQKSIPHGAVQAEGNFNPLADGVAPSLALTVEGNATPAEFDVNLRQGTFIVRPAKPFEQRTVVRVSLTVAGQVALSDEVRISNPPSPTVPEILSASAVLGSKKVQVYFKPIASPQGRPSVRVDPGNGLPAFTTLLSEDAAKSGRVEIASQQIVRTEDKVTVRGEASGNSSPEVNVSMVESAIRVLAPIREGDSRIAGSADLGVKIVCVAVFGPAFSGDEAATRLSGGNSQARRTCREAARAEARSRGDALIPSGAKFIETRTELMRGDARPDAPQTALRTRLDNERIDLDAKRDKAANLAGPLLEEQEAAVDPKTGAFRFNLDRPLIAGAKIFLREVYQEAPGGPEVSARGPEEMTVDSVGLNWGRARGVFTVGATISNSTESFTKADPYVSFYLDGNFYSKLLGKPTPSDFFKTGQKQKDPKNPVLVDLFNDKAWGHSLHWLAQARLTQTGSLTPVGGSPSGLQPVQSAVFQAGFYWAVRFRGMDWTYRGEQYSAYGAPVFKGGVTVLRDGVVLGRTATTVSTRPEVCPNNDCTALTRVEAKEVFNRAKGPAPFIAYGWRLGVMKYDLMGNARRNRQLVHDPVMYIDVTWGQNQAYTTPDVATSGRSTRTANGQVVTTDVLTQGFAFRTRTALEGRVKLPYLPAEIGADVNLNWRRPLRGLVSPDSVPNYNYTDFRFIFGFRLDAAKALFPIFGGEKK